MSQSEGLDAGGGVFLEFTDRPAELSKFARILKSNYKGSGV